MAETNITQRTFDALATLLLSQPVRGDQAFKKEIEYVSSLDCEQLRDFLKQAETQRVLRRTLEVLKPNLPTPGSATADMVDEMLAGEQSRVYNALTCLRMIVDRFEERGHPITIMKTLDHWPDTGSDLDLLVAAGDEQVCQIFEKSLQSAKQPQSWGDRLAHKYNFRVPGLAELVEVHVGCLGQTGEQRALAGGVLSRSGGQTYGTTSLPVPAAEDRIVIATLQRMYRHYYIRLTDIVNIFSSLAARRVDFERLQMIAESGSVWPGVATLLSIVREHGIRYGGQPVDLPNAITRAARFHADRTYLGKNFIRVPLMPEAAQLFFRQLTGNGRNHNFSAMARLSLLPVLATAAFVSFRLTGNDKGIW